MLSQQLEEEEEESDKEIQELKQKIRIRRQQIRTKHLLPGYREMGSDGECCLLGVICHPAGESKVHSLCANSLLKVHVL